jgi:hypothetical protein
MIPMKMINTPKAAKDKFGKKEKRLILLKDSRFSRIYDALESGWREYSQNIGARDAFPGTEEEGKEITQALGIMKDEKKIDIETLDRMRMIFKRIGRDFPELEEITDESRVYGKGHHWNKVSLKRALGLLNYANNSQAPMEAKDEADAAAILKNLRDGVITDEQIQVLSRIYKKYIIKK